MFIFVCLLQLPEKKVPRTIENTREVDETVCKPDDEEVFIIVVVIIILCIAL